jgi:hypothetical protein
MHRQTRTAECRFFRWRRQLSGGRREGDETVRFLLLTIVVVHARPYSSGLICIRPV